MDLADFAKFGSEIKSCDFEKEKFKMFNRGHKVKAVKTVGAAVQQYTEEILLRNKLFLYFKGYERLDNVINLFFAMYAQLDRSSLNLGRIWVSVMQIRTQMTNAVTHLIDQPRFISVAYKDIRMKEFYDHICPCQYLVAKAVQYVVTSRVKHEKWNFKRKAFQNNLSIKLSEQMFEECRKWRDFIIENYELKPPTVRAYIKHLEDQESIVRRALKVAEPHSKIGKNNAVYLNNLNELFKIRLTEKGQANNYEQLRIALATAEDCFGTEAFITDSNSDYKFTPEKNKLIADTRQFLEETVPTVVKRDDEVLPHQMGVDIVGPFDLVHFPNPLLTLELDIEKREYRLKPEFCEIEGLEPFRYRVGKMVNVNYEYLTKRFMKIWDLPIEVENFNWIYPLYNPDEDDNAEILEKYAKDYSPIHIFCLYGGYGYYDKNKNLLSVKAVTLGDDLFFDGPYYIPNPNAEYELKEEVKVTFHPTNVIGPLSHPDAISHGYVHPSEVSHFENPEQSEEERNLRNWKFNAGFFYLFDNERFNGRKLREDEVELREKLKDRKAFFQLFGFDDMILKKKKNSNTPNIARLKLLYEAHREEWCDRDEWGRIINNSAQEDLFRSVKMEDY